jgi:hypothetical protein
VFADQAETLLRFYQKSLPNVYHQVESTKKIDYITGLQTISQLWQQARNYPNPI